VAGITDTTGDGGFSSITGGGETGGEMNEGGCVPGISSSSEGGSLNEGMGGVSSSSGGGSLKVGRGGAESSSAALSTAGSKFSGSVLELFDSETGETWAVVGGASGTAAGIVASGNWVAAFCASCWAAKISRVGAPTEILLRLIRISIGAVRFRTGTRRSDSRFFRAIVGGRISS